MYYNERAHEYEKVYFRNDPIRQKEQILIQQKLQKLFTDQSILEIACGTGYWTQFIAKTAKHITALDYSNEVLNIANKKNISPSKVNFLQRDAYQLDKISGNFEGGIANFWFSHIPKFRIQKFLNQLHNKLGSGTTVFMADNIYIKSIGGTLIYKENDPNTYKLRTLDNGTKYEIIKNYYTEEELKNIFIPVSNDLQIYMGQCFWWVSYKIK
jgi:ubiquinone/menaquinone biosynthesis C-methylase UbiE